MASPNLPPISSPDFPQAVDHIVNDLLLVAAVHWAVYQFESGFPSAAYATLKGELERHGNRTRQ
jgi:hypothetical protein